MIFLTVGTQLPFERLVEAVDLWAGEHPDTQVFAQVGDTLFTPKHMTYVKKLTPAEYSEKFSQAKVVVSHVGMGTIIAGLENAKPLVLMPRLASKGEHRNDHQLGTAEQFAKYKQISFVKTAEELAAALTRNLSENSGEKDGCPQASERLIEKLKSFVDGV